MGFPLMDWKRMKGLRRMPNGSFSDLDDSAAAGVGAGADGASSSGSS
jgi:hypothetical protein